MFEKLKQFKDLRDQAKKIQDALAEEKVTMTVDGVELIMNGNLEMINLSLPADLLSVDKKAKLEKAIREVHAEALKQVQKTMAAKMKDMGGLPNIPGLTS